MLRSARGFTLIELITVIAIILIIVGIITPRLSTSFKNQRLDSDAKKLASNLALAQNYAIGQKDGYRYYGVTFDTDKYWIIPYDDDNNNLNPLPAVFVPSSVNINGDILFSEGISKSSGPDIVIFKFNGSLNANYSAIVLTNGYSNKTITFTSLTGYINLS